MNLCGGLYIIVTSKATVSLNNNWDLVALVELEAILIYKSNRKKLPKINVLQIAKIRDTPLSTCTVWDAHRGG